MQSEQFFSGLKRVATNLHANPIMLTDELWFMIWFDLIACNRIIVIVTDSSMIQDIPKMSSTTRVKIGDEVCITLSVRELREAQQNFGGYQDEMESVCSFQQFSRVHVVHKMLKMIKSKLFVQSCPSQEISNQCFVKEYTYIYYIQMLCLFQVIGKRGVIDGFTDSGGILVKYQENRWVFNPRALGKVRYSEEQQKNNLMISRFLNL